MVQTLQGRLDPEKLQAAVKLLKAKRTAFLARFIVLRESKRSRAHRNIELLEWDDCTSAEELVVKFREEFKKNGDVLFSVDRDLRRALTHSNKTINFFVEEYAKRATSNFVDALVDYEFSNSLLFCDEDEQPKSGGWRLPTELRKIKQQNQNEQSEISSRARH